MGQFYPMLEEADVLILASPVYWFNLCGQIKLFIDRFYALSGKELPDGTNCFSHKKIGLILAHEGDDPYDSGGINAIRSIQDICSYMGAPVRRGAVRLRQRRGRSGRQPRPAAEGQRVRSGPVGRHARERLPVADLFEPVRSALPSAPCPVLPPCVPQIRNGRCPAMGPRRARPEASGSGRSRSAGSSCRGYDRQPGMVLRICSPGGVMEQEAQGLEGATTRCPVSDFTPPARACGIPVDDPCSTDAAYIG